MSKYRKDFYKSELISKKQKIYFWLLLNFPLFIHVSDKKDLNKVWEKLMIYFLSENTSTGTNAGNKARMDTEAILQEKTIVQLKDQKVLKD